MDGVLKHIYSPFPFFLSHICCSTGGCSCHPSILFSNPSWYGLRGRVDFSRWLIHQKTNTERDKHSEPPVNLTSMCLDCGRPEYHYHKEAPNQSVDSNYRDTASAHYFHVNEVFNREFSVRKSNPCEPKPQFWSVGHVWCHSERIIPNMVTPGHTHLLFIFFSFSGRQSGYHHHLPVSLII